MFLDRRLNEQCAFLWVQPGAQPVDHHVGDVLPDRIRASVVARQRMPVGHEIEAFINILILKVDPVSQCPVQVAKMKFPRRPHSA